MGNEKLSVSIFRGHIAILAANIIFGVNILISKLVMPEFVSAYAMAFFRTCGGAILFWMVSLLIKYEKVPIKDLALLALAALFGVLMNQMLFVKGLEYSSPIEAAIVVTFTPIFTMLLAAFFLKEPITFKKVGGVCLGLAGAVIMVLSGKNSSASGNIWGITLCLISGISYAIYLTAFRNLISRYKPVTIMKWMFLFSSMVSLPFLYGSVSEIDYANLPLKAYLELAYVVVGATFITYMLIPVAQKALRPTVLSVYNYVQPITTALLALILGMDSFTWVKALAAALVFLGVYVVTQSKSKAQLDAERNIKR